MTKIKSTSVAPRFEQAISEIEAIVTRMESGQLSLGDSLIAYQRGMELLKLCQRQLSDAELQLRILDEGTLKPYTASLEQNE